MTKGARILDSLRPSAAPGFLCDTGTADAATRAQRRDTRDALLGLFTLRLELFLPCIYAQFTLHLRSFTLSLRSGYVHPKWPLSRDPFTLDLRSIYARVTFGRRSEQIFFIARFTLVFTLAFTRGQRGQSVSLAFTLVLRSWLRSGFAVPPASLGFTLGVTLLVTLGLTP